MLEQLMTEIRAGGTLEAAKLAARLNTSPQMVEAMLEHLKRTGFLRTYESCGDTCEGCSLRQGCSPQKREGRIQLWESVG